MAHRRSAAFWKAAAAVGVTGIMVSAAFAGMPSPVPRVVSGGDSLLGNNSTAPPFFPYLVPGSDYPAPMNLSLGGNVSLPQMEVTSTAGIPSYHLLAITQNRSTYTPLLITGMYSEGLARSIDAGCPTHPSPPGHGGNTSRSCNLPSLPMTWTGAEPLNISGSAGVFHFPVTADAFAVGGSVWAVAVTSQGATSLFVSRDGGGNWTNVSFIPGGSPSLQIAGGTVLLATLTPAAVFTVEVLASGKTVSGSFSASLVTSGSLLSAALVPLATVNASLPDLGLLASDTDQAILFARSNDSGTNWNATVFATASNSTGSTIFDQIGSTALFMPGGTPDMVAASANGSRVFALWTSAVGDGVDALTAVSPNGGATWLGPYLSNAPVSVGPPTLVPMPAGYLAADWRSGTSGTGFVVYSPDGRPVENVQTLPSPSGAGSGTALGVDILERLFFAWPSANGSYLEFTGGFLSPRAAVQNWLSAVQTLPAGDFVSATATNNSTTNSTASALVGKLGALLHMVSGPGGLTGPIEKIEQDLYPKVTNLPLILGCTGPVPVCGHLHRGSNPPWIVNESGLLSANTYLAVYAMWTLESLGVEVSVPHTASPGDEYIQESGGVSWSPCGGSSSCTIDGATVSTTPESSGTESFTGPASMTDPTTATFALSTSLPDLDVNVALPDFTCNGVFHSVYTTAIETFPVAVRYTLAVSELVLPPGKFKNPVNTTVDFSFTRNIADNPTLAQLVGIVSTDLPNSNLLYLSVTAQGIYGPADGFYGPPSCEIDLENLPLPSPSLGSGFFGLPIGERLTPNPPLIQETPGTGPDFPVSINADASMPSVLFANATGSSLGSPVEFEDTTYANLDTATEDLAPGTYQLAGAAQSEAGGASIVPTDVQQQMSGDFTSSPLMAPFSCSITVVNINVQVSALSVSDVGATTAEVSWTSNVPTLSEVSVVEVGVGEVMPPTQIPTVSTTHSLPLTGLDPFAFYTVQVGAILPTTGCLVVETSPSFVNFHTTALFSLSEKDLPYDSITKEGGGALVSWNLPATPLTFTSGFLQYVSSGTSTATILPIEALAPLAPKVDPNTYVENLSTLTPNTAYTVNVFLNLSLTVAGTVYTLTATGSGTFLYLKDTSGDGLSDAEKVLGWYVTTTDVNGVSHVTHVTANPALYASNGLVNDFVEKEFSLNPGSIDTAGSHMLDTYNLTFDLGTNGLPSNIQAWSEPSVNPFVSAPVPGVAPPSGNNPIRTDWTNLSDMPTAGDNYPWAAEVLWNYNSLLYLNGIAYNDGLWLRGVTGTWNGHTTLTVWGKLSWGANPLAASTPGDGIADGARVNPVHEEDLQIYIHTAGLSNCGEGLRQGAGYAAQFFVNATNAGGQPGAQLFTGFSSSGFDTDANCNPITTSSGPLPFSITDYFLVLPLGGQTTQYLHIDTQLVANNNLQGQSTVPLQELPITDNCQNTVSMTVDLVNPPYAPFQAGSSAPITGACSSGANSAVMSIGATAVPAGMKTQTFLWLSNDNSTLSNLPQGLQRYVGEQNFFLVTANITELPQVATFDTNLPLTSDPIPEPWSTTSTYTLKIPLTPGISPSPTHALVNFLVPRGQFLASPFGQAVLRNSEVPGASSLGGPLLSDIFSNPSDQNQASLECYWQQNTFTSGSTVTGCGGGPFPDSFHSVQVLSLAPGASAASCEDSYPSLCGGMPGNPGLSTIAPSPALQGVIALNLSFLDPNNNPSPVDLDTLLAGLLDNATGGVNGTFRDETQNLSFLGLAAPVMSALANGVWDSGGIFGPPVSYGQPNPPSPPTCSGFLGCVWNTVSGIVVGIAGAIYGAVWTAVEAATQFMKQLGAGLAHLAEVAEQAAVSALAAVGAALEAALQALLAFVENAIISLVKQVFSPIWSGITTGVKALLQPYITTGQNLVAYSNGKGSLSQVAAAQALALAPILTMGIVLSLVVEVVLGIAAPVSIGASLIGGLVITAILAIVSQFPIPGGEGSILGQVTSTVTGTLTGSLASFVSFFDTLMNFTWVHILGDQLGTGDVSFIGDQTFDAWGTLTTVIGGIALLASYFLLKTGQGDLLAIAGFGISLASFIIGLIFYLITASGGCNNQPASLDNGLLDLAFIGAILAVLSWPMDFFGIGHAEIGLNKMLAALAFTFFDPIGGIASAQDVDNVLACQKTATPG